MEEKEKIGAAVAAEKSDDGVQKEQTVLSVEKTEIPVADSKNQKDANDESGKSKSAEEKNVKASGADGVNTENKTSDVPEKSEFLDKLMNEARSTYKETVQPVSDGGNEDTDNEDEMVDISDLSALNSADISSNSENKTANISDDKAKKIKSNELSNTVRISLADMTEAMEKSADEKQKRKDERNKKQESKNGSVFLKIVGGLVASVVIIGGAFVCMYKFNPDVIPVAASANVPGGIVRASDEEPVFLKGIKVQGQELEGKNAPGDGTVEVNTENNTVNFLVEHKITQASVQKVIKRVAKKVDIPCVEPHVSKYDTAQSKNSKRYTFEEGSQGKSIDQDALIKAAMDAFNGGQTSVSLTAQSHETKPTLQMSDVKQATKLIGKFSTITTNSYNANVNMETALNSINGTILEPGGTLSFNQCTGNSNLMSNGYLPAGVISQGAMTTGIGGGICQAATTLYNAAIMANMEIVEREPHLWCSYYVYGGLDATIDWGNIDLKVKNNSKYQMFFRCWMDGVVLNVEIYGWQSPEFDEVRTETELDWSSWEAYGYNAYRVFYKNGKKVRSEELPYSTYSLSNGGGIRGADLGNVSTKLTQPE